MYRFVSGVGNVQKYLNSTLTQSYTSNTKLVTTESASRQWYGRVIILIFSWNGISYKKRVQHLTRLTGVCVWFVRVGSGVRTTVTNCIHLEIGRQCEHRQG